MNDWKDRLGVVYSTNNDYNYIEEDDKVAPETIDKHKQQLRVFLDKKQRNGKKVTIVTNYVGSEDALKELGKLLKGKCGVGGSVKDGEIILQGDFCTKVVDILHKEGFVKSRVI